MCNRTNARPVLTRTTHFLPELFLTGILKADMLSSLKRRRFCFCFLLLHHPSRSGSVLRNLHSWFRNRSYPKRCPSGVSALPLHTSLSACNLDMPLSPGNRLWRHSRPASGWICRGSILNASIRGLILRTFHMHVLFFAIYMLSAIHLLPEGRSFLAHFISKLT